MNEREDRKVLPFFWVNYKNDKTREFALPLDIAPPLARMILKEAFRPPHFLIFSLGGEPQ